MIDDDDYAMVATCRPRGRPGSTGLRGGDTMCVLCMLCVCSVSSIACVSLLVWGLT